MLDIETAKEAAVVALSVMLIGSGIIAAFAAYVAWRDGQRHKRGA